MYVHYILIIHLDLQQLNYFLNWANTVKDTPMLRNTLTVHLKINGNILPPPQDSVIKMEAVTPKASLKCTILSPEIIKIASTPTKTSSSQATPSECNYHSFLNRGVSLLTGIAHSPGSVRTRTCACHAT